jgi:heptaprenyl diphosphate synthase
MLTNKESALSPQNGAAIHKAMWLLAAVALNAVELAIPRLPFFPWLKPGFANIITVLWIIRYGFTDAMLYTALRIFLSGFYFGFSLFTFSLSVSGGLLSTAAMSALWVTLGRRKLLGTVGMAVTGALFHNAGQLAVVYLMMSNNMGVLGQIPFMLAASAVFGSIVGVLAPPAANILNSGIPENHVPEPAVTRQPLPHLSVTTLDKLSVALTFAVSISLAIIDNTHVLITAVGIFSLISWILNPKKPGVMLYPLKFYMLFIFVAFTYLIFTPGTRVGIAIAPFITAEGLTAFAKQSMRLWCWLQTAHIFKKFKFHLIFMSILYRFFRNQNQKETLQAGMIALEYFPEAVRAAKPSTRCSLFKSLSDPKTAFAEYMGTMTRRIEEILRTGVELK